jgi:hypothetical protein
MGEEGDHKEGAKRGVLCVCVWGGGEGGRAGRC